MDDELDGRSDCESDRGGDEEDEDEGGPEAADDVVVEGHRSAGRGTFKWNNLVNCGFRYVHDELAYYSCLLLLPKMHIRDPD